MSSKSSQKHCRNNVLKDIYSIFKAVLDSLGVRQIFSVVGGSMGGMLVLEFAYFGQDYVRSIVPISTSASYSAWGISWGEIQRRCIYNDPKFSMCTHYNTTWQLLIWLLPSDSGKYSLEDVSNFPNCIDDNNDTKSS